MLRTIFIFVLFIHVSIPAIAQELGLKDLTGCMKAVKLTQLKSQLSAKGLQFLAIENYDLIGDDGADREAIWVSGANEKDDSYTGRLAVEHNSNGDSLRHVSVRYIRKDLKYYDIIRAEIKKYGYREEYSVEDKGMKEEQYNNNEYTITITRYENYSFYTNMAKVSIVKNTSGL